MLNKFAPFLRDIKCKIEPKGKTCYHFFLKCRNREEDAVQAIVTLKDNKKVKLEYIYVEKFYQGLGFSMLTIYAIASRYLELGYDKMILDDASLLEGPDNIYTRLGCSEKEYSNYRECDLMTVKNNADKYLTDRIFNKQDIICPDL